MTTKLPTKLRESATSQCFLFAKSVCLRKALHAVHFKYLRVSNKRVISTVWNEYCFGSNANSESNTKSKRMNHEPKLC